MHKDKVLVEVSVRLLLQLDVNSDWEEDNSTLSTAVGNKMREINNVNGVDFEEYDIVYVEEIK